MAQNTGILGVYLYFPPYVVGGGALWRVQRGRGPRRRRPGWVGGRARVPP
jgi:hypothetical protein